MLLRRKQIAGACAQGNDQAADLARFHSGDLLRLGLVHGLFEQGNVVLDAAAALRRGDLSYANACIDRIVSSSENLLVEIADLGNAEEYIEFNTNRFDTRELNLKDRQKTLEATDLESEITLMKTYEAIYNACLQMSSKVVPNSIFNYIS